MSYEDFGLRLKLIRRHHKLTQDDISKQLNISRQAYSNYEQGRCLPPPNTLAKICILLNTNLFSYFIQKDFQQNLLNYVKSSKTNPTNISTENNRKVNTKMINKKFAAVLTEKRIAAGYTQAQAADALYLSRSTYNHYENGTRIPSAEVLVLISIKFKIDPIDLLIPLTPSGTTKDLPLYANLLPNSKLSSKEKQILAYYRCLEKEEQQALLNMANLLTRTHGDLN